MEEEQVEVAGEEEEVVEALEEDLAKVVDLVQEVV